MNSKPRLTVRVTICFAALFFAGCYGTTSEPAPVGGARSFLTETEPLLQRCVVGRSVENRPIGCLVLGRGRDITFILATIHGDEPAGTALLHRLVMHLHQHPRLLEGHKIVLLPVANPDGMARNSRFNARGVDLNRNFGTANRINSAVHGFTALSEPEARVIERIVRQYRPDRIVSIHQLTDTGPEALSHHVPNGCIDYDGPAKELAERMAQHCDLPVKKLGAAAGSLGSYAGLRLRKPTVTVELPREARTLAPELLWERYGAALVGAVTYSERQQ